MTKNSEKSDYLGALYVTDDGEDIVLFWDDGDDCVTYPLSTELVEHLESELSEYEEDVAKAITSKIYVVMKKRELAVAERIAKEMMKKKEVSEVKTKEAGL